MKNVNLTVTVRTSSGCVSPHAVMIDGATPVHLLGEVVGVALITQTHFGSEDCVTILKISYTPEG